LPRGETNCPYCAKTFHRADHVLQHLRGYHHIVDSTPAQMGEKGLACPHEECREEQFSSRTELRQHLREAHGEAPFPCVEENCNKSGAGGYIRERDLLRHQRERHSTVGA
jgi:hypothetical protein